MNITLVSAGSRGDIAPFAALAAGLQAAGHQATVLAHSEFAGLLAGTGVRFLAARGENPRAILDSVEGRRLLANSRSPRSYAREFRKLVDPVLDMAFQDTLDAAQGADLLIYPPMAFGAFNAAEKLGIPSLQVHLQPILPSSKYPTVLSPIRTLGPIGNRLSHAMAERILSDALRESLNRARANVMGLPPRTGRNLMSEQRPLEAAPLLAFDAELVPRANGWPADAVQCGALLTPPQAAALPAPIEAFLAQPGPCLYVGFGSMVIEHPERVTQAIAAATAAHSVRAIVQRGWGGLDAPAGAPQLLFIDDVDHDLLFPRVSAVIHHGGAGTTARAIRSGRPSLVVPLMGDQFFWGHRAAALGVGPAPLKCDDLSAANLTTRIGKLLERASYREAAEQVRARVGQTAPLRDAVAYVESLLSAATGHHSRVRASPVTTAPARR